MNTSLDPIVAAIVSDLEGSWNAADGSAFGRHFTDDADFINIRGDHFRSRDEIARGHQMIFDSIYKGSRVQYRLADSRLLTAEVALAHVRAVLDAPVGPLAGQHRSIYTIVLVQEKETWKIAAFHNTLIPAGN